LTVIEAAFPTRLVSEKLAGVATPVAVAVTMYGVVDGLLSVAFAVNVEAVARPVEAVVAVVVVVPFANVPLAPVAGAWKVTTTPLTTFPP